MGRFKVSRRGPVLDPSQNNALHVSPVYFRNCIDRQRLAEFRSGTSHIVRSLELEIEFLHSLDIADDIHHALGCDSPNIRH